MFFSLSSGATASASRPPLMTMLTLRAIGERDRRRGCPARASTDVMSGSLRSTTGTSDSSVQSAVLSAPAFA